VQCLKNHSTPPDLFTSLSRPHNKVPHPPFYLFHGHSLLLYQLLRHPISATLPSHDILFFLISELRSAVESLAADRSDAPFDLSDAPTLTPMSKIVSPPDTDSNVSKPVSNRLSGPYIYASTFCERLRPSTSYFNRR
jgi:hypothetical protein